MSRETTINAHLTDNARIDEVNEELTRIQDMVLKIHQPNPCYAYNITHKRMETLENSLNFLIPLGFKNAMLMGVELGTLRDAAATKDAAKILGLLGPNNPHLWEYNPTGYRTPWVG